MRRNVSSVSKQFVKKASNLKCVKLSTEEELSKYLEISAYFYNILSQRSSEERSFSKTHLYLSHLLPSSLSVGDSLGFLSDIQTLNSVISSQELNLFLFYSLNFLHIWVFCLNGRLCTTCMQCLLRPEEDIQSPGTRATETFNSPCGGGN